jgi:hypothetical protein
LSPGRSDPAAISRRTCSQISSNTRLVRIGANRGCDRSFAAAFVALAADRRAAGLFFARAGVVAAIFLVTVWFTSVHARMPARSFLIPTCPGWTAEPNVLDEMGLKCINGLSNNRRLRTGGLGLQCDPAGPAGQKERLGAPPAQHRRDINQTVARDDVVGGDRLQHWRGGAAA